MKGFIMIRFPFQRQESILDICDSTMRAKIPFEANKKLTKFSHPTFAF